MGTDQDQGGDVRGGAAPQRNTSPGYPGIDIKTAIDRVEALYKVAPHAAVPMEVAAEEWGFSPKSSNNLKTAAALKRFGFVTDTGSREQRQLKLTPVGRELAFSAGDEPSEGWWQLVRDAAVHPKIHQDVLEHFGGVLPDARIALRYLLFELGFQSEATAKDFLRRLRATIVYAFGTTDLTEPGQPWADGDAGRSVGGLTEPDDGGSEPGTELVRTGSRGTGLPMQGGAPRASHREEPVAPLTPVPSAPQPAAGSGQTQIMIPYANGKFAALSATFPLSEVEWATMTAVLQAMKGPLVTSAPEADLGE